MSKISVLTPVYNVEEFLPTCIDSILAQTFWDFELILVDDGSTDDSLSLCIDYSYRDKRIKVIAHEHEGVSSTRNRCLDEATSDFLCFIDSDDYIHPDYLTYLLEILIKYKCDIVQCMFTRSEQCASAVFSHRKDSILIYNNQQQMQWGLCGRGRTRPMFCGKLFKRNLFEDIRCPVGRIHEDEAIIHRLFANAKSIAVTNEPLYYYRLNSKSIMNEPFSEKRLDIVWALIERMEFYRSKHLETLAYATAQRCCVDIIGLYRKLSLLFTGNDTILTQLHNTYRSVWQFLQKSPLLNSFTRTLHEQWLDDPLQGEQYCYWEEFAKLSDSVME
jgi:glycosyltransferase involved in cell wall biosynthesis